MLSRVTPRFLVRSYEDQRGAGLEARNQGLCFGFVKFEII